MFVEADGAQGVVGERDGGVFGEFVLDEAPAGLLGPGGFDVAEGGADGDEREDGAEARPDFPADVHGDF